MSENRVLEKTHDFQVIEEQHEELRRTIADLKQYLETPRPEVGTESGHDWATALAERLTRLHDKLFRHFREEESIGYLDELEQKHPQASRAVAVLRREHDRILCDVRALLGSAMVYSEGKPPADLRLRRWTLSVLDQIARHEHEETDLFQGLHYTDLGAGD